MIDPGRIQKTVSTSSRRLLALAAAQLLPALAGQSPAQMPTGAPAQAYPAKTVRIVLPVPPGGLRYSLARASRVITAPEFRDRYILGAGLEFADVPTDAFAERIGSDRETYAQRLKALGAKLE